MHNFNNHYIPLHVPHLQAPSPNLHPPATAFAEQPLPDFDIPYGPEHPLVSNCPLPHPDVHAHVVSHVTPYRTLPDIKSIPPLRTASDWTKWSTFMVNMVDNMGLWGHLCHIPTEGQVRDLTSIARLPPYFDEYSDEEATTAFKDFWDADVVISHILTSKLSNTILNLLPSKRSGPHDLPVHTAHDVFTILSQQFSVGSLGAAKALRAKLCSSRTLLSGIPAYVKLWHSIVPQLEQTCWDFSMYDKIQGFVDGLPHISEFSTLRDKVHKSWKQGDKGTFTFTVIADEVIAIDHDCHHTALHHQSPTHPCTDSTHNIDTLLSAPTTSALPTPASNMAAAPKPCIQCSNLNCGQFGHTIKKCWSKGGGMEGGRDPDQSQP
ncbi:hypothetical protein H0H87_006555 [Tephrocybe sp. NHM501043]|nr:hypothetical protein H0H87_006555 [Tephrocybe sp. NHM501043]